MEWGAKENRVAIIALHKCNKAPVEIFKFLKPLGITQKCVYRTIKRFSETSSINDRARTGRPRVSRTPRQQTLKLWRSEFEEILSANRK